MKVFVAGATGAIGRSLVPRLVERGHDVTGTTRSPNREDIIRGMGAEPSVMNGLDSRSVWKAIARAEPEVVVHESTAIPPSFDLRRFDEAFVLTNRLRTEGTDNLVAASKAHGVRRLVAQSYAAWPYERRGSRIKTEEDALDDDPPSPMRRSLAAIKHLEPAVLGSGLEGIVLRYGAFYGTGTAVGEGGSVLDLIRKRRFPVVGSGAGVWSMIHIDDAAEATALAVERAEPGVYNITDDEPAPVREWLPYLAQAIGAPRPRHVPVWVARLLIGDGGIAMMTEIRGASNSKARKELGWEPRYATWRDGFTSGLA